MSQKWAWHMSGLWMLQSHIIKTFELPQAAHTYDSTSSHSRASEDVLIGIYIIPTLIKMYDGRGIYEHAATYILVI